MSEGTTYFGQWLRQRRRSLDLTQTELAQRVGCSVVSIRKLEVGERHPSRHMASLLADHLGIAAEERPAFIRFARTDHGPEMFLHPVFAEAGPISLAANPVKLAAPDRFFPADIPAWIRVKSDEIPSGLANRLMISQFHSAPTDAPCTIVLHDGRNLCKIVASGRVAGSLQGTLRQEITQLHQPPQQDGSIIHTAVWFHVHTETGLIKGACTGFMTWSRDSNEEYMELHGKIYDVSETYADLFLAEVHIESHVVMASNGIKDHGLLTILPR